MNTVRPCDVIIAASNPEAQLLVVETFPLRLQAGTIVLREELEVVTLPGTYRAKDLGDISRVGVWEYERAARALSSALFDADNMLHTKIMTEWHNSLLYARAHNQPFTISH